MNRRLRRQQVYCFGVILNSLACLYIESSLRFSNNDGLDAPAAYPAVDGAVGLDEGFRPGLC